WTVQGLTQSRWSSEVTINDSKATFLVVLNGDKGWISGNGQAASELKKEQVKAFGQLFTGLRLGETLVPLTGKEWKLATLGELKIGGKLAAGIRCTRKDFPEIALYFDAKTHLPVQVEMRVTEAGGMEVAWTAQFEEYQKFGSRQHFTKLTVLRDSKT